MSVCLDFYFPIKKEIQDLPVEREYRLSYDTDQYNFHLGCGIGSSPLAALLIYEKHLEKGLSPEHIAGVKFIRRQTGKHNTKEMLALAYIIKDRLEKEGDNLLRTMGLELNYGPFKTRDVLQEQLEDFIIFCEFGMKNKLKEYKHLYQ